MKSLKYTLEDGATFSYLEQEKYTVEFIALYASDFINNEMKLSKIISHKDNGNYFWLKIKNLKAFKDAKNVKERYKVWRYL